MDNLSVSSQPLTPPFAFPYGSSCASAGGCAPALGTSGVPFVGNNGLALTLTGAAPASSAMLLLGFSSYALPLGPYLPGNACTLLTIPVAHPPVPVSGGTGCAGIAIFTLPIPSGTPSGGSMFTQWIDFDPAAYPAPTWLSATGGLRVTVL